MSSSSPPKVPTGSFFNRAPRRRTSVACWTLCLTSKGSKEGSRRIVNVNPTFQTVCDLYEMAGEIFKEYGAIHSLTAGFPPKALEKDSKTVLLECGIGDKERIQVTIGDPSDNKQEQQPKAEDSSKGKKKKRGPSNMAEAAALVAAEESGRKDKKAKVDDNDDDIDYEYDDDNDDDEEEDGKEGESKNNDAKAPRRSKRAAAQAATESFGAVIKEQDRLMASEQPKKKKQKQGSGGHIISTSSSTKKTSANKPLEIGGTGRRLGDGAVIRSPTSNKRKQPSSKSSLVTGSNNKSEDMSVALLGALNDSGTMGRILRKGLSNAVQNSFETNKAVTRIAAVIAYTSSISDGDNAGASLIIERPKGNEGKDDIRLDVKFAKGVQGRGFYEESVDYIPKDVLSQVIQGIHKTNQEALRPQNIAFLSPRVLWSLVYHFCYKDSSGTINGDDSNSDELSSTVEEAMQKLLPDLDWTFLKRRKQALSEKAKENLRQEQMEKGEEEQEDWDKAAEAIQDVEHAMENLQSFDRSQRSNRMANAALKRQQQQQEQEQWSIVTPTDSDEEELQECIATASPAPSDASTTKEKLQSEIVNALMEKLNIHNWRELANVMDDDDSLAKSTTDTTTIADVVEKCNEALQGNETNAEQVEQWRDHAQQQSLDEIMIELCDSDIVAVELLRENARSGTPKDLGMWKHIPEQLYEECTKPTETATATMSSSLTVQMIETWCHRAEHVLKQFEWLNWYATPIE